MGSDRIGSNCPPEGRTARKSYWTGPDCWAEWAELLGLGWACKRNRTGPRSVNQRRSGSGGSGGDGFWAAVLAPGRRDDGRNGRGR
ncbi:hypothetical protein CDL15_Pgr006499 [Punica granatum]|uniref:Uncharacterized protein n=1 Tax=Punica granatum TaxID=22663 RepID=A0A218XZE8_PUNGR|nr:hypothetical protein CDL15_Pgr006499 [Punica granatum]PKI57319.1 hypothetical protein CRG98_022264 [Punica granatum]